MRPILLLPSLLLALAASAQSTYDAAIVDYVGLKYPCDGEVVPTLRIQNQGTATMGTCVVETWKNGAIDNSFNWVLAVPAVTGAVRQPALPVITGVQPGDVLEFRIISVNTVPDQDPAGNIRQVPLDVAPELAGNSTLLVEVTMDAQATETSWVLRNASGIVLAQGAGYTVPFEVDSVWVTTAPGECLMLRVTDAGGDGMAGGVRVFDGGGLVSEVDGASFTDEAERGIVSGTVTAMQADDARTFSVAPLPATDRVTVRFISGAAAIDRIELFDATGRNVRAWRVRALGNGQLELDLSGVTEGLHFLRMSAADSPAQVVRIVVAR
jgi:hypothetical protein